MTTTLTDVLFIDDDKATNFFNTRVAQNYGKFSSISSVQSGLEGLNYLKGCIQSETQIPKLIFLDINMPAMNGWEFLNEFKKLKKNIFNETCVVILSTSTEPDDISKFEHCKNILDFINKPINTQAINKIFEKIKNLQKSA